MNRLVLQMISLIPPALSYSKVLLDQVILNIQMCLMTKLILNCILFLSDSTFNQCATIISHFDQAAPAEYD